MPKFPFSRDDPFPEKTHSGKPYATDADIADWGKKFKAWYAEKKADPEYVFIDQNEEPIERKPWMHPEEHVKFLETFKDMPAEERLRLGHTVNEEQAQPFHTLHPGKYTELEQAAVYLNKNDETNDRYYRHNASETMLGGQQFYKGKLTAKTHRGTRACYTDPIQDYMGDLRAALEKKSDEPEAETKAEA